MAELSKRVVAATQFSDSDFSILTIPRLASTMCRMDPEPLKLPIEGTIDLHPFAPADVVSVVDEYVREAHAAGFREVRLIHGRGRGIQRGMVQAALERHPLVEAFWDAPESHLGATVARLAGPCEPEALSPEP